MKTLTEFSGVVLRRAIQLRDEQRAAGVAPDAVAAAMGEQLGLHGDRLARLREAIDAVGGQADAADAVRRVRVYQGEPAPAQATTVGEFHYVVDRIGPDRAQRKPDGERRGRKPRRPGPDRKGSEPRGHGKRRRPRRGDLPDEGDGWTLVRADSDRTDSDRADSEQKQRRDRDGDDDNKRRRRPRRPGQSRRPGHRDRAQGDRRQATHERAERADRARKADDRAQPDGRQRRRQRRRKKNAPDNAGNSRMAGNTDNGQVDGNVALPPRPEVNGNVALPDHPDIDDAIGNR